MLNCIRNISRINPKYIYPGVSNLYKQLRNCSLLSIPQRSIGYFIPIRSHITEYTEFQENGVRRDIAVLKSRFQSSRTKLSIPVTGVKVQRSGQISEILEINGENMEQRYQVSVLTYAGEDIQYGIKKIQAVEQWLSIAQNNKNLVIPEHFFIEEIKKDKNSHKGGLQLCFLENQQNCVSLLEILNKSPQSITENNLKKLILEIGSASNELGQNNIFLRDINPTKIFWDFKKLQWQLSGVIDSELIQDNQVDVMLAWSSVKYIAPEIRVSSNEQLNLDINKCMAYSIGVILEDILKHNNININKYQHELFSIIKKLQEKQQNQRLSLNELIQQIQYQQGTEQIDQNIFSLVNQDQLSNKQKVDLTEEFDDDHLKGTLSIQALQALNKFFEIKVISQYLQDKLQRETEKYASNLTDYGQVLYSEQMYSDAQQLFLKGQDVLEKQNKGGLLLAKIYRTLAQIYSIQKNQENQEKYLKKSDEIFQDFFGEDYEQLLGLTSVNQDNNNNELINIQENDNNESVQNEESNNNIIENLQKNLKNLRRLGHTDSMILAHCLEDIHKYLEKSGQYKLALDAIDEVTSIKKKFYNKKDIEIAKCLTKLALTNINYGDYESATKYSQVAHDIYSIHSEDLTQNQFLFDNLLCQLYCQLIPNSTQTQLQENPILQKILQHLNTHSEHQSLLIILQVQNLLKLIVTLIIPSGIQSYQHILQNLLKFHFISNSTDSGVQLLSNVLFSVIEYSVGNSEKCLETLDHIQMEQINLLERPYRYQVQGLIAYIYIQNKHIDKAQEFIQEYQDDVDLHLGTDNIYYIQALALNATVHKTLKKNKANAYFDKCKTLLRKTVHKQHIMYQYIDNILQQQ